VFSKRMKRRRNMSRACITEQKVRSKVEQDMSVVSFHKNVPSTPGARHGEKFLH